jgi:hypothetical protein
MRFTFNDALPIIAFVALLCSVLVYFVARYVNAQKKKNEPNKEHLQKKAREFAAFLFGFISAVNRMLYGELLPKVARTTPCISTCLLKNCFYTYTSLTAGSGQLGGRWPLRVHGRTNIGEQGNRVKVMQAWS